MERKLNRGAAILVVTFAGLLHCPSPGRGQAWVMPDGQARISVAHVYSDVGDHLFSRDVTLDGTNYSRSIYFGDIFSHTTVLDAEYGFTPEFTAGARLPYVQSRYSGGLPEDPAVDDGTYRGGFQDLSLTVRYALATQPLTITPRLTVVIPTNSYETLGHVAIGRALNEYHAGIFLGYLPAAISPDLVVQAGYDYAIVQVLHEDSPGGDINHSDLSTNYSSLMVDLGYFFSPFVFGSASLAYKATHGGLDWADDTDTEAGFHAHDRYADEDFLQLFGSISVDATDALTLRLGYTHTLWGSNTHELRSLVLGASWAIWLRSEGF